MMESQKSVFNDWRNDDRILNEIMIEY